MPLCLEPLRRPRRRWRWASAHTPLVAAPLLEPLARAHVQLAIQLGARFLAMYEIAESSAHTSLTAIQATTGFAKIGDGREFAVNRATRVPAGVERVAGLLAVLFVFEAHVNVADEI